jgi:hypothetical protein
MTHVVGCKQKKYHSGRDTVESFGDGRFEIGRLSGEKLVLGDAENRTAGFMDVYKYKTKGNWVFASSEEDTFAVLNYETGDYTMYKDINFVPDDYKKIFSKIRMYKKYFSRPETIRSYGNGRFQLLRTKEGTNLYDMEKQEDIVSSVSRWYDIKRNIAFIASNEGVSILLNYETGIRTTYQDFNSVPAEFKFYLPHEKKK